ncbi:MAG: outer membrane beta-barrel protein, partial [Opitutae bacterium]|nr:outer membrane beta-barrel protein [Opitutae bacterium]
MNKKKLIQMMLAVTLPGVATFGEISITDNLGVRGFVQGSYEKSEVAGTDNEKLDMNWADVDFLFSSEKVGAEVHLKSDGSTVDLEQAFLTYDLGGGLNVTGGKYLSLLGYEGDEPYKLYQRSMAYVIGDDNKIPFAAYHQGVKIAFSSGDLSGAISVVDDVYNSNGDAEDVGFEAQIKYTGLENFTIAIGTAQSGSGDVTTAKTTLGNADPKDDLNATDDYYNFWVEYGGIDSLILGAE